MIFQGVYGMDGKFGKGGGGAVGLFLPISTKGLSGKTDFDSLMQNKGISILVPGRGDSCCQLYVEHPMTRLYTRWEGFIVNTIPPE